MASADNMDDSMDDFINRVGTDVEEWLNNLADMPMDNIPILTPTQLDTHPPKKRPRPNEFSPDAPDLPPGMPPTGQDPFGLGDFVLPDMETNSTTHVSEDQLQLLLGIIREIDVLKNQMNHIHNLQQNLPVPFHQGDFEQLNIDQQTMIMHCQNYHEKLDYIMSSNILSPVHITQLLDADQELTVLIKKLMLYQEELRYYYSYNPQMSQPRCFSSLLVTKQPFPKPIKHNTRAHNVTEDPVIVEMISAPKASCRPQGFVKAQLMNEDFHSRKASTFEIKNSEQEMDDEGIVRFSDLRFPSGSRQKIVRLQFTVDATYVQPNGAPGKQQLESNLSQPFIIMTNENQWRVSEGALLKKYAFEGNENITWAKFANILQVHYLRATRQNTAEPQRPLSLRELQYLAQLDQFKGKPMVHVRDFEAFWNWFGDAMHKIRHQKPFSSMWLQGDIFGFICKADVNKLLSPHPHGTFLFRFSERCSGQVAVAYVAIDPQSARKTVVHYLLSQKQCEDIVDFLTMYTNLQWLLPAKTEFDCRLNTCFERPIQKKIILERYGTPSGDKSGVDGYSDNMPGAIYIPPST